jgi:nicotinamidase-related amidase
MSHRFLNREKTGLWLVDVQENLFPLVDRYDEVLDNICFAIECASALKLPIFVTEQYPEGLGPTVEAIKKRLPTGQVIYPKTTFSGYKDPFIQKAVDQLKVDEWILIGIEAHICVLQTAKDLIEEKKRVVVLNDAVTSRSLFDFSTAMGELRDNGIRISSTETVFYELVRDSATPAFKAILPLIKSHAHR